MRKRSRKANNPNDSDIQARNRRLFVIRATRRRTKATELHRAYKTGEIEQISRAGVSSSTV